MTLIVVNLLCEYKRNPIGLDAVKPRFSWQIRSDLRHVLQDAYQIQVFLDAITEQAPLWDTGKVNSDQSIQIEYVGPEVRPCARYYYKVRIWDKKGNASVWSELAFWESGLLSYENWKADWITADPNDERVLDPCDYMRRKFPSSGKIKSARIYATALGLYQLYMNGQRVGNELFAPGWTSYKYRIQYQTYDVTQYMLEGENSIGVILGNGWYKGPLNRELRPNVYGNHRAALVQLHLTYEDGREEVMVSDDLWKTSKGPILYSEIYEGELYDANKELTGWSLAGNDDRGWSNVSILDHDKKIIVGQENDPTRVIEQLKPIAIIHTPAGETVLDMGQNMVGWMRFHVNGQKGASFTLQHAEVLDKDGKFYTGNLREAKQRVTYICKGGEDEVYEPHFTFQGFRYVKIEGFPIDVSLDQFIGCVIHTDMDVTGEFECSDPLVNRLQKNILWGQKGNFLDVPTDCPQRNERLGWVGDAQIFIRTAGFNMNVASFFTKWLHDLSADQREDGAVPDVIPNIWDWSYTKRPSAVFPDIERHSSSAWADAAVICPWTLYLMYGDKRILSEQYDSMKAWVEFIRRQGEDEYLWNTGFHYGDWLALDAKEDSYLGATPNDFIATSFYAYSTELLVKTAEVLQYAEDVRIYSELYSNIVRSFRNEFVTSNGRLIAQTQTAHVLALMFNLVEEKNRKRVAASLAEGVREQNVHLSTGFVGTPYLCLVLSQNGYHDLACELVTQTDYPSWLYAVTKGATTIWEHWDSQKPDGSFWSDNMNSFNHYAYGSVGEWFYRIAAGLDINESKSGYKLIEIAPKIVKKWTYAQVKYNSMYGEIRTGWNVHKDGKRMTLAVSIPANTTARVVLPNARLDSLQESGLPIDQTEGILSCNSEIGEVCLELGSGTYEFEYPVHKVVSEAVVSKII